MPIKQFLKPDWKKIVIAIVLILILILSSSYLQNISIIFYPLTWENCAPGSQDCQQVFNWFALVGWFCIYIISCFIMWIIRRKV